MRMRRSEAEEIKRVEQRSKGIQMALEQTGDRDRWRPPKSRPVKSSNTGSREKSLGALQNLKRKGIRIHNSGSRADLDQGIADLSEEEAAKLRRIRNMRHRR